MGVLLGMPSEWQGGCGDQKQALVMAQHGERQCWLMSEISTHCMSLCWEFGNLQKIKHSDKRTHNVFSYMLSTIELASCAPTEPLTTPSSPLSHNVIFIYAFTLLSSSGTLSSVSIPWLSMDLAWFLEFFISALCCFSIWGKFMKPQTSDEFVNT